MTRVLVVDHHDSYTCNLVHLVAAVTGDAARRRPARRPGRPRDRWRDGYSHVVLSPGPGTVHRPGRLRGRPRGPRRPATVPVLGVCLGMQGLVDVLGGTVVESSSPRTARWRGCSHTGTGVFAGLPQGFAAVRYHSLAALDLPDSLQRDRLVRRRWRRRVVMGVQHVSRPLDGVQFHPESILTEHGERAGRATSSGRPDASGPGLGRSRGLLRRARRAPSHGRSGSTARARGRGRAG